MVSVHAVDITTKCEELENPANGVVIVEGNKVGSSATYRCDDGFTLTGGDETRVCQPNGEWSGMEPTCAGK